MAGLEYRLKLINDASKELYRFQEDLKKLQGQQKESEKSTGSLGDTFNILKAGLIAFVGSAAVKGIIAFGKECVDSFNQAELSATKLYNVLKIRGLQGFTGEILDYAEAMMEVTGVEHEEIESAAALGETMGINAENIKQASTVALDLSAAIGVDLNQAMKMLGQYTEGNLTGIGRWLPELKKVNLEGMSQAQILALVGSKVQGLAESMANTGIGTANKYKNSIGELNEAIGQNFAMSLRQAQLAMIPYINKLTEIIQRQNDLANISSLQSLSKVTSLLEMQKKKWEEVRAEWIKVSQEYTALKNQMDQGIAVDTTALAIKKARMDELNLIYQQVMELTAQKLILEEEIKKSKEVTTNYTAQDVALKKTIKTAKELKSIWNAISSTIRDATNLVAQMQHAGVLPGQLSPESGGKTSGEAGGGSGLKSGAGSRKDELGGVIGSAANLLNLFQQYIPILNAISEPLQTVLAPILQEFAAVLLPTLNAVLQPFYAILAKLGSVAALILLPLVRSLYPFIVLISNILEYLIPIIQLLGYVFKGLAVVIGVVYNIIAGIINVFIKIINFVIGIINAVFGWLGVHINKIKELQYINVLEATEGTTAPGTSTTSTSSTSTTYAAAQPINITVYINTSAIVGENGIRELALMIKNQIALAEGVA